MFEPRPIHPSYAIWFGVALTWWVLSELFFFYTINFPAWYFPAIVLFITAIEIFGASRGDEDETDTASEFSWWFQTPEEARSHLTTGIFAALCYRIATVPFIAFGINGSNRELWWYIILSGPIIIIAYSLYRWLRIHIRYFGKDAE